MAFTWLVYGWHVYLSSSKFVAIDYVRILMAVLVVECNTGHGPFKWFFGGTPKLIRSKRFLLCTHKIIWHAQSSLPWINPLYH